MKNLNQLFSRLFLLSLFSFAFFSCEDVVEKPIDDDFPNDSTTVITDSTIITSVYNREILVISQGGFGLNTASLHSKGQIHSSTFYTKDSSIVETFVDTLSNDIFYSANEFELGDMANDIITSGDKIYILVSNSGILEIINKKTYESEATINLKDVNGEFAYPQNMEIYEGKIYITDASASNIIVFDIASESVSGTIPTGPNPADIEIYDGMVYTANTAYGNTSDTFSGNRTVSVIDIAKGKEIKQITVGTNTRFIDIDEDNNVLYVGYTDITWDGKIGGIKSYNLTNYEEINSFDIGILTDLQVKDDNLYFITSTGLNKIDLFLSGSELFIQNLSDGESWSSFLVAENDDIWILNAKGYTTNGSALYFESGSTIINPKKYEVGVAPIKIIFNK
jgi:hypothetical protein